MTRRELIGMMGVGVVAVAAAGVYAFGGTKPEASDGVFPVQRNDAQWRAMLSPASYDVLRMEGTEAPFSSALLAAHRPGMFACTGCANRLFDSSTKFDSHIGWPSFWDVLPGAIMRRDDTSFGMSRTEVRCAHCGGHLGHVFDDGPKPTGLRYCMNGVAMTFQPAKT